MNMHVCSALSTFVLSIMVINGQRTVWLTSQDTKTPPTLACGGVDLVFLVDTSRSIWDLDFKRQIDFIEKVVSKFDIGPAKHQTRVGVIQYAHTFWVRFYLRSHLTLPSLQQAIRRIPHKHGSKTRTERALKFLRTHMFKTWYGARKNATHVAILISDGKSQDIKATRREAKKTKDAGVKIFTIGVGKRADIDELKEIASDPDEYFVFQVGNFKALDSLNYKIPTSTCVDISKSAGSVTTETTTVPTTLTTMSTTTVTDQTTLEAAAATTEKKTEDTTILPILSPLLSSLTLDGQGSRKFPETASSNKDSFLNTKLTNSSLQSKTVIQLKDSATQSSATTIFTDSSSHGKTNLQFTESTSKGLSTSILEDANGNTPSPVENTNNIAETYVSQDGSVRLTNGTIHIILEDYQQNEKGTKSETDESTEMTIDESLFSQELSPVAKVDTIMENVPNIILSNNEGDQLLVTPPSSKSFQTTMSNNVLQQIILSPVPSDASTTNTFNIFNELPTSSSTERETTEMSNSIIEELAAAYSLRPITEDQAQIMSNYILRDVPAQTYCDGKDADIYFVLDASNSIWPEDFKQQLTFVNNVIDILDVTHGNTRVGVVVYSTNIHPIVMINSGLSKRQIKRQVNAIKYVSGRTNTSDALRYIRQYGFEPTRTRKDAVKLGIILTDGISRNPTQTKTESNLCREQGIHLFAVGIGKNVDQTELKRIANDPDQKFMFHVDSYAALNSIKDFLAITACSVAPDQPNTLPICSGMAPMDVILSYDSFALGSRKSQMINFFIHDILNSLDFSNGNLQVGRLTDNCPELTNIPLMSGQNLSAFASTPYPGIARLLQKMNSSFSGREDVKKLGILFVDDSTEGIEQAIKVLKKGLDYKLMMIGIGDPKITDAAADLCSYPKHDYFMQVPKYSSLLRARSKLLDKLCTTMTGAG